MALIVSLAKKRNSIIGEEKEGESKEKPSAVFAVAAIGIQWRGNVCLIRSIVRPPIIYLSEHAGDSGYQAAAIKLLRRGQVKLQQQQLAQ